jgi:hypothetical protein
MPLTPHEALADRLRAFPVVPVFAESTPMTCRCKRTIHNVPEHLRDCCIWVCELCAGRNPDVPAIYRPSCKQYGCNEHDPDQFDVNADGRFHSRCRACEAKREKKREAASG